MQTRRTFVVGVGALAVVSIAAVIAPQTVGAVLAAFLCRRLPCRPDRPESARMGATPEPSCVRVGVGALVRPTDRRLDADGSAGWRRGPLGYAAPAGHGRRDGSTRARRLRVPAGGSATPAERRPAARRDGRPSVPQRRREVSVDADATAFIASTTCDQQRDLAAALWAEWRELGDVPATGTGVTIKSYTGRTLASAEQGLTGARFHCE